MTQVFISAFRPINLSLAILFLSLSLPGGGDARTANFQLFTFKKPIMGSLFEIRIYTPDQLSAEEAAEAAFAHGAALEQIYSDYLPDSELMQLCKDSKSTQPSRPLYKILSAALELGEESKGAFDVTSGHLTQLWRRTGRKGKLPSPDILQAARAKTGHTLLQLDPETKSIALAQEGMLIDLGGIAKGATADAMLGILQKHGFPRAAVAASGDIRLGDPPPGKVGWEVDIAPHGTEEKPVKRGSAKLARCAVSSSGDAHQHVTIDGTRYSHIIDPLTGLGLTQQLATSVIAETGQLADALATATTILIARGDITTANSLLDGRARRATTWNASGEILFQYPRDVAMPTYAPPDAIAPPPPAVAKIVDALYTRHLDCGDFPILATDVPSDRALYEAQFVVSSMLAKRPEILRNLASNHIRLIIMAPQEMLTALPEYADMSPQRYWDRRARGLGPTRQRRAVSTAEENLLAHPGDPFRGESNLVHEIAHAVHLFGMGSNEESFDRQLQETYDEAMQQGLWADTYAAENYREYWAEGVQSYFDTNRSDDRTHNKIDTREELKRYDPRLFTLCEFVFSQNPWRHSPVKDRLDTSPHLKGYDPQNAPRFAWPPGLDEWYRATYPHLR